MQINHALKVPIIKGFLKVLGLQNSIVLCKSILKNEYNTLGITLRIITHKS